MSKNKSRKKTLACQGAFQPVPIEFIRSTACASLSPHASKLLLDVLASMAPNAVRNGDISLAHKLMRVRGWKSRSTLHAAIQELVRAQLLTITRQGSRLDCTLYACTLYPLDCDLEKLDVKPGTYRHTDYMQGGTLAKPPTDDYPAVWNQVRKTETVAPPRDDIPEKRPASGRLREIRADF